MNELIKKAKALLYLFWESDFAKDMAEEIKRVLKLLQKEPDNDFEIKSSLNYDIKNNFENDFNKERMNETNEEN